MPFVKHRVNEILKMSGKGDWRNCPSRENRHWLEGNDCIGSEAECLVMEGSFLVDGVGAKLAYMQTI